MSKTHPVDPVHDSSRSRESAVRTTARWFESPLVGRLGVAVLALAGVAATGLIATRPGVVAPSLASGGAGGIAMLQPGGGNNDEDKIWTSAIPTMHVRGEAELERPADQVVISIAVITEAATAGEASQDNREKVEDVMDALKKLDLGEDALSTANYRVEPIWDYRQPERANRGEPFEPQIRGYRVHNTVEVETKALDKTSKVLRSAIEAGANTIQNLSFELSDPRMYRQEAIREAVQHARQDAAVLAEAAGVQFVKVLSIQLDDAMSVFPQPYQMAKLGMAESAPMMARGAMADAGGPSGGGGGGDLGLGGLGEKVSVDAIPEIIEPGKVTVRANVTILYEIKSTNTQPRTRP